MAGAGALVVALFWTGVHGIAAVQSPMPDGQVQQTTPTGPPPLFGETPDPRDPAQRQRLEKMEKARQADRQQQLVRDTDKLLGLAKELKEEVNKSNKDMLSIDVVKKAAEIEKLAKSVKERMRG